MRRYRKQQVEIEDLKRTLNSNMKVDIMKRNSLALKAAISEEEQRYVCCVLFA